METATWPLLSAIVVAPPTIHTSPCVRALGCGSSKNPPSRGTRSAANSFSPAILPLLRRAGCEAGFLQLRPAVLSAMRLHFGTRVIRHPLPEPAYGLSRYELDRLLLEPSILSWQIAKNLGTFAKRETPDQVGSIAGLRFTASTLPGSSPWHTP